MRQLIIALLMLPVAASAIDHSKLDYGRPLRIDDAHPLALGEMAIEFGTSVQLSRSNKTEYRFEAAYLYGFAPAMHLEVSAEPSLSNSTTEFGVGLFLGVTRETQNLPATAIKLAYHNSDGQDELSARAILTGQIGPKGKWHMNGEAIFAMNAPTDQRKTRFAAAIGYSTPIGLPNDFSQTLVAAFNLKQSSLVEESVYGSIGIGIRKQIGIREVLDFGIETDLFAPQGAPRTNLRLSVGLSSSF
jgi:hypothetical protein